MEINYYKKYYKYKQKYLELLNQSGGINKEILFICGNKTNINNQIEQINKYLKIEESDINKATIFDLVQFNDKNYDKLISDKKKFHAIFYLCKDCKLLNNQTYLNKFINIIIDNGIIYFINIDYTIIEKVKDYFIKNNYKIFVLDPLVLDPQLELDLNKTQLEGLKTLVQEIYEFNIKWNILNKENKLLYQIPIGTIIENQDTVAGCGRHALNNLFGQKLFTTTSGNSIDTLDVILQNGTNLSTKKMFDLSKYCRFLQYNYKQYVPKSEYTDYDCPSSENYHYRILIGALSLCGYTSFHVPMIPMYDLSIFKKLDNFDLKEIGYYINYGGGHWVCLQRSTVTSYKYKFINSIRSFSKEFNSITEYVNFCSSRIHNIFIVMRRCIQINDPGEFYETTKSKFLAQKEIDKRIDKLKIELEERLLFLGLDKYTEQSDRLIIENQNYIDLHAVLEKCSPENIYTVLHKDGTTKLVTEIRVKGKKHLNYDIHINIHELLTLLRDACKK